MQSLPTAHTLEGAHRLQARYTEDSGLLHHILLGEHDDDVQLYYIVTAHEAKKLIAAGYEPLENGVVPLLRSSS
jgi:hypothetical protein